MRAGLVEKRDRGLASRAAGGAGWLMTARFAAKLIDFITLLALARLLTPADFGMIALAMTSVLIAEAVLELPVNQVLVGLAQITPDHFDTAFTLGAMRGVLLTLVLSAVSIPLSYFYSDSRLPEVVFFLSLGPALRGLLSPTLVLFVQTLDFRREFVVELTGKLAGCAIGVGAAVLFRDFRAIIVSMLATSATMAIVSYILAPYRPRLSLAEWRLFASFLSWTTGAQFLGALSWQCDRFFLARYVGASQLGEFSLANDLSYTPEQALVRPILRPLMSAFVLVRDNHERLVSVYLKSVKAVLLCGLPVMIGLGLLAQPAVEFALGGKWIAAVPILQWLPFTLIPPLLIAPFASLAIAVGRPDLILRQTSTEAAYKIPMIFLGASMGGIAGVIVARSVSAVCSALVTLYYVRKILGVSVKSQLANTWPVFIGGISFAVVVLLLRSSSINASNWELGMWLAAVSGLGMLAYLISIGFIWLLRGRPAGLEQTILDRIRLERRGI